MGYLQRVGSSNGSRGFGRKLVALVVVLALAVAALTAAPAPANAVGQTAKQVSAGDTYTCAVLGDNTVKCWGGGSAGQLGQDSTAAWGASSSTNSMANLPAVNLGDGRTAKQVSAGYNHTCAILDDDSVKCWGQGFYGQLGQNSTAAWGASSSTNPMASLPAVNLGDGRTAKQVSVGQVHTCAVLDDDSVKCWGGGSAGQLGQDSTAAWGASSSTNPMASLPAVNLGDGRTAKQVSAGQTHTCAVLDDDSVKCWGGGAHGQLGQDSTANWGTSGASNSMASLPAVNLGAGRTAIQVISSKVHTCAVLDDGTVKCWGQGGNGQLGQDSYDTWGASSSTNPMANLPAVNLGDGRTASQVSAGLLHTCVALDDDSVKCWGNGGNGRLGQDSTAMWGAESGTNSMASLTPVNLGAAPQEIEFTQPPDTGVNAGPVVLTATGGASGNPVTFTSATAAVCTADGVNGASVTLLAAGTCTINADQAGDATYSAAPQVQRSFQVTRVPQTIDFTQPADTGIGAGPVVMAATGGASGNPVTFTSATAAVCTADGVNGASVTLLAAGTCTINAGQAGDATYAAAPQVQRSFEVTLTPLAPSVVDVVARNGAVSVSVDAGAGGVAWSCPGYADI